MNEIDRLLANPRVTVRRKGTPNDEGSCVVYWMQRAQRGVDNPALDIAIAAANELRRPIVVFFGLNPKYPNANLRHYTFMIEGLEETRRRIEKRGAEFVLRSYPDHDLFRFCAEIKPCLVVCDENPLREPEKWRQRAAHNLRVPFWTVDADVIAPSKLFPKEEYAARTLRPKLNNALPVFLQQPENLKARYRWTGRKLSDRRRVISARLLDELPINRSAMPVSHFKGGTAEGMRLLRRFINKRLPSYDTARNQPQISGTSELSAYLHFGHLSPVTIALAIRDADAPKTAKSAFLEELIVRREVAINYVARNPQYDSLAGSPEWGRKTLADHASDSRPYYYTAAQLEDGETHDPLWNASQLEMVITGRMHGYMRMYWAKKILEWTAYPEDAFEIAVKLNDRYELDGRDPNGYTGIAWAIGGKHDRPWGPQRPVFGLIRYMSYEGCFRKFDAQAYIDKVNKLCAKEWR